MSLSFTCLNLPPVAPFAGARVETLSDLFNLLKLKSLPSRERELKHIIPFTLQPSYKLSLPSRERELKLPSDKYSRETFRVAPFAGARVETNS